MRPCLVLFSCTTFVCATFLFAESAGGLKWTAPAGWKSEGTAPMRAATYPVPAAPGDKDRAECVVYFFGKGQGGTVEANLERWKGQFQSEGKAAPAKVTKRTIHGLAATMIDVSGDYSGMGGPMAKATSVAHDYTLLGAIVESAGGNVFVKFAGPRKTVAANRQNFEQLIGSFAAAQ